MPKSRVYLRIALIIGVSVLACQQIWRHGRTFVFIEQFEEVEPGEIYRGAWQKDWPMRRLVGKYHIKTIVALAHSPQDPMTLREKALAEELDVAWKHIPIVDERQTGDPKSIFDPIERAAGEIAKSSNHPVYFHCHHGVNRASMVQIAYRTLYCGWTLDQATDEIARTFGLRAVNHGPDYRWMTMFYNERVLPRRAEMALKEAAEAAATKR